MLLLQLIFVILFHVALADNKKEYYDINSSDNVNVLFENFLQKHDKNYDAVEKLRRLQIFNETLTEINRLNDAHSLTIYGITYFADLTYEEMNAFKGFIPSTDSGACMVQGDPQTHDAPSDHDWRQQGAVTPVKNQMDCGSCWTFSATATIESRYAVTSGQQLDLSEQQLVDCDDTSSGCQGGSASRAFTKLIAEGGQEQESDYPYINAAGTCQFDSSKVAVKVASCSTFSLSSEDALKEVLFKEGPLSIALAASFNFHSYRGGILDNCDSNQIDHAVQLIGYGSESGVDYWIIKNSWGTAWGENGIIRMKRGVQCLGLLNQDVASVTLA